MLGKKVLNHLYWHSSITALQPIEIQKTICEAENLANLNSETDYNVVKYELNGRALSFLYYADFFDDPFPVLQHSYRIDFGTQRVEKRRYQTLFNPPILHRKELLLAAEHPQQKEYQQLTTVAETIGLFDHPLTIGFKKAWENLIQQKGYQLIDKQFLPLGNADIDSVDDQTTTSIDTAAIARHLTALSRSNLSAPMQCLARYGFLDGRLSVFDYGCGKGDDIRNLSVNQISVSGWDPFYAPDQPKHSADIVNLGFVINVIENYQERLEAVTCAYKLANQLLVVSVMLYNQNAFKGQAFNDGVLTQRNTFQKYFTQGELKDFLSDALDVNAIPVAPGIFFVFKDPSAEQLFLLGRQRSSRNVLRLSQRLPRSAEQKLSRDEQKYQTYRHLLDPLWEQTLLLGRLAEKQEIDSLVDLTQAFGTINKALQFMLSHKESDLLKLAREARIDDLITYFALQTFARRKPYKHLDSTLQSDIKAFFGDYKNAVSIAQNKLFQISRVEQIALDCQQAAEQGLGYLDIEGALILHSSFVNQLPSLLRIYVGCATILYGDLEQADLIKIHSQSGKLSLMCYDDFIEQPLPRLQERVKINLREQTFDVYRYGEDYEPTYLYLKSRYINEDFPHYSEQLAFDEQLQALNLFDLSGHGPNPNLFRETMTATRWEISDLQLIRSRSIPELDTACGRFLSYRQLIECGETQQISRMTNLPQQADTYTALYELAINILDPVIDYFGMIRLSYGFCSHELGKLIKHRVAPKLDQHAAHELNSKKQLICPRLGAAVDFIVDDENMRDVADWVAENTPFDRLYFYGDNRPIHVSYGPEQKGEYIDMVKTDNGRVVPKKRQRK